MFKRIRILGSVACLSLVMILVLATPALAASPGSSRDREGQGGVPAPPFAEGIFTKSDVETAAKFLGIDSVELENQLWAGRTLAEIADGVSADITALRNAVDAARYRELAAGRAPGPPLKRQGRDDAAGRDEGKDCRDDCDRGKDCRDDCDKGKDCCAKDTYYNKKAPEPQHPDKPHPGLGYPGMAPPSGAWMRTTARGGLNLRYGPGTSYGVFANVPYGTPVLAVYGAFPHLPYGWTKIVYNGRELWAANMYLAPM